MLISKVNTTQPTSFHFFLDLVFPSPSLWLPSCLQLMSLFAVANSNEHTSSETRSDVDVRTIMATSLSGMKYTAMTHNIDNTTDNTNLN